MITLILSLVQELIVLEPQVAAQLQDLFAKKNPTPADWEATKQSVLGKSYSDYVPASALPPSETASHVPAVIPQPTPKSAAISNPGVSPGQEKPTEGQNPAQPPVGDVTPSQPAPKPAPAVATKIVAKAIRP